MTVSVKAAVMLLLVAGAMVFVGCATIVSKSSQDITIGSDPRDADFVVSTTGGMKVFSGKTPATVTLKRKNEYKVEINMEGYQTAEAYIQKGFNGWVLGNLVCGGLIGIIIDYSNGAAYKLEPDMVQLTLVQALRRGEQIGTYAVLRALDSDGQLRTLVIPLIEA